MGIELGNSVIAALGMPAAYVPWTEAYFPDATTFGKAVIVGGLVGATVLVGTTLGKREQEQ